MSDKTELQETASAADISRVESIGMGLADQFQRQNGEVRVNFRVSRTADAKDCWLTIYIESVSSKRSQTHDLRRHPSFYTKPDSEIEGLLREEIGHFVRYFLKKMRS